jgi:hypothetical protein
LAPLQQGGA